MFDLKRISGEISSNYQMKVDAKADVFDNGMSP